MQARSLGAACGPALATKNGAGPALYSARPVRPVWRVAATNGSDESGHWGEDGLSPEDVEVVMDFYVRRKGGKGGQGQGDRERCRSEGGGPAEPAPEAEVKPETEAPPPSLPAPPAVTAALPPPPPPSPAASDESSSIHRLQDALLSALASLDRGVAATDNDVLRVDNLARQLEVAGGTVVLEWAAGSPGRRGLELLDGRWRLVYSSGFAGGNLGGRRPGPPAALLPLTLGPVYQDISVGAEELDNVVTLTAKLSVAPLLGAQPPALTARLKHTFTVEGASTVRIVFEKTVAKTEGGLGGWLDALPQLDTPGLPEALRPATAAARGATFDVTFLDERMRITRGDRGELRVFLKD